MAEQTTLCNTPGTKKSTKYGPEGCTGAALHCTIKRKREKRPSKDTDRYSLSVLLFYLFMVNHPLEGKLEGHISLANAWLSEVSEKLGVQEREETVLMHHMILSHHGKMEYGSPVAPMIIEAEALYLIDNMDARLTSLKMALDAIKPGTWTSRMFQFENRQFYKHK